MAITPTKYQIAEIADELGLYKSQHHMQSLRLERLNSSDDPMDGTQAVLVAMQRSRSAERMAGMWMVIDTLGIRSQVEERLP